MPELEVVRAGGLTTVQDLGRPGLAHLGVPRAGALDEPALVLANRLVGNPDGAAALETTLTGVSVRATGSLTVAVTGAAAPVRVDGNPAPCSEPVRLDRDQVLDVGPATAGVRSYVAVVGGLAVPPVLGSRSTDTLGGLGPAPLADRDRLPVGNQRASDPDAIPDGGTAPGGPPGAEAAAVRVRPGWRADWFAEGALAELASAEWVVSPRSNRVGVRLDGPRLARQRADELPSEGLVLGAVQVPPDGSPIVFLADHPTTGGYPVLAVVEPADVPLVGQLRPGGRLRLTLLEA